MKIFKYIFYGDDGYPVTYKEITVSDKTLPQELDEYGYEELEKFKADYLPVANFTYEEIE